MKEVIDPNFTSEIQIQQELVMKLPDYTNIYAMLPSIMIDGVLLMDMKVFIVDCNDSLADLTQFSREQLLSMNWKKLINPTQIDLFRLIYYNEILEKGYSDLGEIGIQRKDESKRQKETDRGLSSSYGCSGSSHNMENWSQSNNRSYP